MKRRAAGFTLLELLVALSIFALIAAMAYGGMQRVVQQRAGTEAASDRLSDLQKAYRIMQRDLEQMVDRPVRNEFGDTVEALVAGGTLTTVEFSRAGHANPAGFLRSDIQRVAYFADQDVLMRRTWRVLDRAQDSLPDDQVLVEGLQRFTMRFLDGNQEWRDSWPVIQSAQPGVDTGLPIAMEVQLELDDIGVLDWIFVLPQAYVVVSQQAGNNPGAQNDQSGSDAEEDEEEDLH